MAFDPSEWEVVGDAGPSAPAMPSFDPSEWEIVDSPSPQQNSWQDELAGIANRGLSGAVALPGLAADAVGQVADAFIPGNAISWGDSGAVLKENLLDAAGSLGGGRVELTQPQSTLGKLAGNTLEAFTSGTGAASPLLGLTGTGGEMVGGDAGKAIAQIATPFGVAGIKGLVGGAKGLATAAERSAFGIRPSDITKANKRKGFGFLASLKPDPLDAAIADVRSSGATGLFDDISPQALLDTTREQSSNAASKIGKLISEADNAKQMEILPQFDNLESTALKLFPTEREKAAKLVKQYQDGVINDWDGSIESLNTLKKQLSGMLQGKYGKDVDPTETKLLKALYKDLESSVSNGVEEASKAIPDGATAATIRGLNREISNRRLLEPILERAASKDKTQDITKILTNFTRTSGGRGTLILASLLSGGTIGKGILGGLALDALTTPKGRLLTADTLRGISKGVERLTPSLSSGAFASPIANALMNDSQEQDQSSPSSMTEALVGSNAPLDIPLQNGGDRVFIPPVPQPEMYKPSSFQMEDDMAYSKDSPMVKAIIAAESTGDRRAVSPKGAQGLMQLMPETGRELARKIGVEYDPFDPEQNVLLGTEYFNQLLDRYNGDDKLALAAYNWGLGRIDKLIKKLGTSDFDKIRPHLPSETKTYVKRVMDKKDKLTVEV